MNDDTASSYALPFLKICLLLSIAYINYLPSFFNIDRIIQGQVLFSIYQFYKEMQRENQLKLSIKLIVKDEMFLKKDFYLNSMFISYNAYTKLFTSDEESLFKRSGDI